MRRLGMLMAVLLLAPAQALIPTEASAGEESNVHSAYVKVALSHGGTTYEHPGLQVSKGETSVFMIECDGQTHEIAIELRSAGEERLGLVVEYSVNGRSKLREQLEVDAGVDTQLSKGNTKLVINVDPHGRQDTSRKDVDKIDEPDGDDPLGGASILRAPSDNATGRPRRGSARDSKPVAALGQR